VIQLSDEDFGSRIERALNAHASDAPRAGDLAGVARHRIRRRRTAMAGAAAVALAVVTGGGLWNAVSSGVQTASDSSAGAGSAEQPGYREPSTAVRSLAGESDCPPDHPIVTAGQSFFLRDGISLDATVSGASVCRYRTTSPALVTRSSTAPLLGAVRLDATRATGLLAAIRALPEVNPALPKVNCRPDAAAHPREAIVLRFDTPAGVREIWVGYDGCATSGFYSADAHRDLAAPPLSLFMIGTARPTQGTWLSFFPGW
jgi:hypothetical protein